MIPNPTQTIQHWENFFQMCGLAAMQTVLLGLWREIFIDNTKKYLTLQITTVR